MTTSNNNARATKREKLYETQSQKISFNLLAILRAESFGMFLAQPIHTYKHKHTHSLGHDKYTRTYSKNMPFIDSVHSQIFVHNMINF